MWSVDQSGAFVAGEAENIPTAVGLRASIVRGVWIGRSGVANERRRRGVEAELPLSLSRPLSLWPAP